MRPVPGCVTYSSAKACSSFMAQALNFELKDKVDVMSWEAGMAGTKMFPEERRPKMPKVGPSVDAMLRDVTYGDSLSWGSFSHDYKMGMFATIPTFIMQRMMYKAMKKSYEKDIEKVKKEGASMEEWLRR